MKKYTVYQYGIKTETNSVKLAMKIANEFWARDFAQIINNRTGRLLYGRPQ